MLWLSNVKDIMKGGDYVWYFCVVKDKWWIWNVCFFGFIWLKGIIFEYFCFVVFGGNWLVYLILVFVKKVFVYGKI